MDTGDLQANGGCCGESALATQFKEGQSGNPSGRPKGSKNIKTILRELVDLPKKMKDDDGNEIEVSRLEYMCAKLVRMAQEGDLASMDRVFDRLEGKPEQTNKNTNDNKNLNVDVNEAVKDMTDEQLEAVSKIMAGKKAE